MCRIHHLMLVTPLLGVGLVLGGAEAAQASTLPGSANTVVGDVSPQNGDHDSEPGMGTHYRTGYKDGYDAGIADSRNACTTLHRQIPGTFNYVHGFAAGYSAAYSTECPGSKQPSFRFTRSDAE